MKVKVLLFIAAAGLIVAGCKKNAPVTPTTPTATDTTGDLLKDSVLLYARDIYLWYKNIPSDFNAQSYADPNAIMVGIRPYSLEPGFSQPVDRWSFAVTKSEWDGISNGISGDFGMGVFFFTNSDLRVSYSEKGSPAGKAGIKRGWRIKQINGSSNITPDNANAIIQAVYYSSSTSFTFTKPTGEDVTMTLAAANYQEDPVFLDSVYTAGSRKVGYLVFNSFLGDTTAINNEFANVFSHFATQQVQDMIIDLRYNGGGYVSVQNTLADYLISAANNGDVMETQQYNDKYASFDETIKYNKLGSLNPERIFFIVSKNTASASELLINSLKPYYNVQLVGPSATHGKPVGFFPIPVGDWYIFPVSFRTINKNGDGNYFNGLPVNYQVMDGLDKDWGDISENCLASVLHFIGSGSYARTGITLQMKEGLTPEVQQGNINLGKPMFKGAVGVKQLQ